MEKSKIITALHPLIIGGSAGSLTVLLKLLPSLRADIELTIIIVLHRKNSNDTLLSDLFATRTTLKVKEIEDKEMLKKGAIYIAPADYHILFESNGTVSLDYSEKVNYSRPSIDVAYESAAIVYKETLACLLLSGASSDGTKGLLEVKKHKGKILIQDPATAESPYMPQQAINKLQKETILRPEEMTNYINSL